MSIRNSAKKLPYPIKQGLKYAYGLIPFSIRYGKVFRDTYEFLQKSQWWSREKLEEYQMQQLSNLLNHAYENVPYYRRVFDERGLKPHDIQTPNDLKQLPFLTKNDFKKQFRDFVASDINVSNLRMMNTSGTSGKPLQFYWDFQEVQKEWAFICHLWSRVGYKPGDLRIEFRGAVIGSYKPFQYDPITKVLRLSPRVDSKDVADLYLKKIESTGARFLHGYPSAIGHFGYMVKKHNLPIKFKLRAILFASETIYPWQQQIVQEIFGCRAFGFYGMTEHVVMAGECENSTNYHCVPQYGITEIDTATNEIIGTSFLNYANPFIRYRTTDIASQPIKFGCGECGRHDYPVFPSVEGRLEDFIITPNEIPVSPAVITHPFKGFETIRNSQIIQKSLSSIKLRIVPWDNYDSEILKCELEELCKGLQNILGPDMKIETEILESLQTSKSGKFKWIISEVSKDLLQRGIKKVR